MSEYELAALFYQVVDVANASLANFLTITSAMLVVCYLAAAKLDRVSAFLVLTLFTVFSMGMINEIYSEYRDLVGIGMEIARSAEDPGSSLKWHGFAIGGAETDGQFIPRWVVTMSALAYFGTIWFFFHMRRRSKRLNKEA